LARFRNEQNLVIHAFIIRRRLGFTSVVEERGINMSMLLSRTVPHVRGRIFRSLIRGSETKATKFVRNDAVHPSRVSSASFHQFSKFLSKKEQMESSGGASSLSDTVNGMFSSQRQAMRQLGIVNGKIIPTNSLPTTRQRRRTSFQNKRKSNPLADHQQKYEKMDNHHHYLFPFQQEARRVRVKSVHAAQTIDVVAVLSKVFGVSSASPPVRHMFGKSSVIMQLPPVDQHDEEALPRFVAVYRFGSVVFFNFSPRESGKMLEAIKKYATVPVAAGFERMEHFEVLVHENASMQSEDLPVVTGDFCLVDALEMNSVAVISQIMAQTTALDSYSDIVDELLANFASINSVVTRTGNFTEMEKNSLFRVIAQNNSIFIDMTSKLGIKDRSDTAWNLSQYDRVHTGLKSEFEIEDRFENIEFKLDMIQQNAKFFMEVLHNQKSNKLEWIIIVLIGVECVLMFMDMSGTGTTFLSGFSL
jgi:uncharacterized Rmd1/YagE family protein